MQYKQPLKLKTTIVPVLIFQFVFFLFNTIGLFVSVLYLGFKQSFELHSVLFLISTLAFSLLLMLRVLPSFTFGEEKLEGDKLIIEPFNAGFFNILMHVFFIGLYAVFLTFVLKFMATIPITFIQGLLSNAGLPDNLILISMEFVTSFLGVLGAMFLRLNRGDLYLTSQTHTSFASKDAL